MSRRYLITGCSGGGKSTLIEHLADRGMHVILEPGLRVIEGGGPKPWEDRSGFIETVTAMSRADLERPLPSGNPTFFDRGLFDALSGRAEREKVPLASLMHPPFPYAAPVFFAPPWPEIFEQTDERPHSFEIALDEAQRLRRDLELLGIEFFELPRVSVEERAGFVLARIG